MKKPYTSLFNYQIQERFYILNRSRKTQKRKHRMATPVKTSFSLAKSPNRNSPITKTKKTSPHNQPTQPHITPYLHPPSPRLAHSDRPAAIFAHGLNLVPAPGQVNHRPEARAGVTYTQPTGHLSKMRRGNFSWGGRRGGLACSLKTNN